MNNVGTFQTFLLRINLTCHLNYMDDVVICSVWFDMSLAIIDLNFIISQASNTVTYEHTSLQ